jgi:hypothetical protein
MPRGNPRTTLPVVNTSMRTNGPSLSIRLKTAPECLKSVVRLADGNLLCIALARQDVYQREVARLLRNVSNILVEREAKSEPAGHCIEFGVRQLCE